MGLGTLVDKVNGNIIDQSDPNDIHLALEGAFVGRDSSGAPTAGQALGTASIPWGIAQFNSLILNGSPVDPSLVTSPPNSVISGAIRSTSEFPNYLQPAGAAGGAIVNILGAATTLTLDVNGSSAEITTDIAKTGLTVAPAANNTCQIFDLSLTGTPDSLFVTEFTVSSMGSELTSKVGEFVALINNSTNEIFYGRIASTVRLDNISRGFFFDSSLNPIVPDTLTNGNILQIMSLGFVFAEDDGVTIDVSYTNPVISGNEPGSPATGDYWYDLNLNIWRRFGGATFDEIDRTYIGAVAINTADCIGARPEYFTKAYRDNNTLDVSLETVDIVTSSKPGFVVSTDGQDKRIDFSFFKWDASTDFESGFSRTVSRNYWLYITEDGVPKISGHQPYSLQGFLRGDYHPYNSWRAVAKIFNNGSNEFEVVSDSDEIININTANENTIVTINTTDANADITIDTGDADTSFTLDTADANTDITIDTSDPNTSVLIDSVEEANGASLKFKKIDTGDWNMLLTASINVAHGLALANILSVAVIIRNDTATTFYDIQGTTLTTVDGSKLIDATNIVLTKTVGGLFESSNFNSTSFNRGTILITYLG